MKKHIFILATAVAIAIAIALISCSTGDTELDRTIFVPDEDNPELPAYTEWGYNSFGAIYERQTFVSTDDIVPCKMLYRNDTLNFVLQGERRGKEATLWFAFPFAKINDIPDLEALNNLEVDLAKNGVARFEDNSSQTVSFAIDGKLHFKRFQLLKVDDKINRIILSGTFEVKFIKNGLPETLSDGRFDMGITGRNFYSYEN